MGEVNGYICSETKLSMHTCEAVYSGQDGPFKILPAIVSLGKQFIRGEDLPVWKHGGEFEQSTFVNTIAGRAAPGEVRSSPGRAKGGTPAEAIQRFLEASLLGITWWSYEEFQDHDKRRINKPSKLHKQN
jgi:hypothetical protein